VLGFTLALSLVTGVVFGLAPALQSSRPDLLPSLKDESYSPVRSQRRFTMRNLLVVAQVALSLALLIGAGLFLRSLWRIQNVHPGFDADKVLIARLCRFTRSRIGEPCARHADQRGHANDRFRHRRAG
jgi:hypothetical protein